jgi:hypothetical protein
VLEQALLEDATVSDIPRQGIVLSLPNSPSNPDGRATFQTTDDCHSHEPSEEGKMRAPLIRSAVAVTIGLIVMFGLRESGSVVTAQSGAITVQFDKPGAAISPTMFGLFFEDINFGADGGIYPERIKNRSFEFTTR